MGKIKKNYYLLNKKKKAFRQIDNKYMMPNQNEEEDVLDCENRDQLAVNYNDRNRDTIESECEIPKGNFQPGNYRNEWVGDATENISEQKSNPNNETVGDSNRVSKLEPASATGPDSIVSNKSLGIVLRDWYRRNDLTLSCVKELLAVLRPFHPELPMDPRIFIQADNITTEHNRSSDSEPPSSTKKLKGKRLQHFVASDADDTDDNLPIPPKKRQMQSTLLQTPTHKPFSLLLASEYPIFVPCSQ